MIKRIDKYIIIPSGNIPSKEDIAEAIDIAKKNNCIVSIEWDFSYGGHYQRYIYDDDEVDDVYDNRMPKEYP